VRNMCQKGGERTGTPLSCVLGEEGVERGICDEKSKGKHSK